MDKKDLVEAVANIAGKKKTAEEAANCVLDTISEALKNGDRVALIGFGTFSVAKRATRKGRNPMTGREIKIKAKEVPKFRQA